MPAMLSADGQAERCVHIHSSAAFELCWVHVLRHGWHARPWREKFLRFYRAFYTRADRSGPDHYPIYIPILRELLTNLQYQYLESPKSKTIIDYVFLREVFLLRYRPLAALKVLKVDFRNAQNPPENTAVTSQPSAPAPCAARTAHSAHGTPKAAHTFSSVGRGDTTGPGDSDMANILAILPRAPIQRSSPRLR